MRTSIFGFIAAASLAATAANADVVVSADPTTNMSCAGGTCSPTDRNAVLNINELTNLLATSDVTISNLYPFKKHFRNAGPIDLRAPLSWASGSKLTLDSESANVSIESPVSVLGSGGLVFTSGAIFASGVVVSFADLGSVFSIGGVSYTLIGDFPTLAGNIAANPSGHYALANDYDAAHDKFRKAPIESFKGQLIGLGHTISNLTIPKGRHLCEGMIGLNLGGVSHLKLNNISVKLDNKSRYTGGVAGCNQGGIFDVAVSGHVTGTSNGDAGGIAGINFNGIVNARSVATVTGGQAGGIAGENNSGINDSSAAGAISGVIDVGGLVGLNTNSVSESFATGTVSGTENNTGGLIGSNHGDVTYCYAMGNVGGTTGAAGGFVGFNGGTIQNAYSTGTVIGGSGHFGGFAGSDLGETIATAYWDTETSGITNPAQGAGDPQYDPGIVGLTTAQFVARLPFGFDKNYWGSKQAINNGYPYLLANPPQ